MELGCYDGKSIDFLPYPPEKYEGYDANWKNGLTLFKEKWSDKPNYQSYLCNSINDFNEGNQNFDLVICMETLENLPRADIPYYLEKSSINCDGYAIFTIPNKIGLLFFAKYILKFVLGHYNGKNDTEKYTLLEFFYQIFGITDKVEQNDHKGFNYKNNILEITNFFEILTVEGTQFPFLPVFLGANIGIVCKKK